MLSINYVLCHRFLFLASGNVLCLVIGCADYCKTKFENNNKN